LHRRIGHGAYGQVWLAEGLAGSFYAVKVVWRHPEDDGRSFDREYRGILNYEPISRSHHSLMDILHLGRNETEGCFWYAMELADDARPDASDSRGRTDTFSHVEPCGPANSSPRTGVERGAAQSAAASASPRSGPVDPARYIPDTLKHRLRGHRRLPFDQSGTAPSGPIHPAGAAG
jgi:hypothetical protein